MADSFPPWIREPADALRRDGAVEIVGSSSVDVELRVHDGLSWTVTLRLRRDGGVYAACDCPAGRRGSGCCRHVWAGVRVAEDAGLLHAPGPAAPSPPPVASPTPPRARSSDTPKAPRPRAGPRFTPPREPDWRARLHELRAAVSQASPARSIEPLGELWYTIDGVASARDGRLSVNLAERIPAAEGRAGLRPLRAGLARLETVKNAADREVLALLLGSLEGDAWGPWRPLAGDRTLGPTVVLEDLVALAALPRLCATRRCLLRTEESSETLAVTWDDGDAWQLRIEAQVTPTGYALAPVFSRGAERRSAEDGRLVLRAGLVFFEGQAARLDHGGLVAWFADPDRLATLRVPRAEAADLAIELALAAPDPSRLDVPPELRVEAVTPVPRPRLTIRRDPKRARNERLACELTFDYDGHVLARTAPERVRVDAHPPRLIVRDLAAEARADDELGEAGVRASLGRGGVRREIAPRRVPGAVRRLLSAGWYVEAEGGVYRRASGLSLRVKSGVDWFGLEGEADFDGRRVPLPMVLQALRRGETMVALGDCEFGLLPDEWLRRFGLAARLGEHGERGTRFHGNQIGLLDALLATEDGVDVDAAFAHARARLRSFEGLQPCPAPPGFQGELRGYQREGLGWLRFLDEFGFGGCLADDMGLGKTVQVLALLVQRRAQDGAAPPALVVAPRSLVFNWTSEAARFAPGLRINTHSGLERARDASGFAGCDVVLTTYGTLRRDVAMLREIDFDYVILDEAQAIKNAGSETAKAARLLRGRRRLALSGTPVENHLGELHSLFEFLNPGMLGRLGALGPRAGGELADAERELLARAVRPFVLRRTKEQVAGDLPAKTEQTLLCELDVVQRRLYDEIRDHYRSTLLGSAAPGANKLHVLAALLRLRQAACHPGLLDPARRKEPSAKLDALLPRLVEVVEEGHKALVFSQFTSLLALVRARLAEHGVEYESLDGRTRDRAARVARFQEDPACRVFLVSLKAGGLGLNLTAAEYVFLLDPWWNPAVEAQAVDRAHRLGQQKPVFAYRLIAKDTIEEKVLELQASKRRLADAIIAADQGPLGGLKREDLELLLS